MNHAPSSSKCKISIHSLVKRETLNILQTLLQLSISIHSLVKRETHSENLPVRPDPHFNPLPRKEGDVFFPQMWQTCRHFNPLPRKEGDAFFNVC